MKVTLNQINGLQFRAVADSGHALMLDGANDGAGARPMEAILAGLGGCSVVDVLRILHKSRQAVKDCVIEVTAERVDAIPAVFRTIHLRYIITGSGLERKKVERAVALSLENYCSVARMLEKTAAISHQVELIQTPA